MPPISFRSQKEGGYSRKKGAVVSTRQPPTTMSSSSNAPPCPVEGSPARSPTIPVLSAAVGEDNHEKTSNAVVAEPLLSDFHVRGRLGKGGFGVVLVARQKTTGLNVAIKILQKQGHYHHGELVRNEVKIQQGLDHLHVLKLLSAFEDPGRHFLVFELAEKTLEPKEGRGLGEPQTAKHMRQVASAVSFCHEKRIVHRDIKPANILVLSSGVTKLADFGCACVLRPAAVLHGRAGTPAFMAPEVARSEPYNSQADIWSLGMTIFGVIHGHLPKVSLACGNKEEKMAILHGQMAVEASPACLVFLVRLLQVEPASRPTASQLLQLPWLQEGGEDLGDH